MSYYNEQALAVSQESSTMLSLQMVILYQSWKSSGCDRSFHFEAITSSHGEMGCQSFIAISSLHLQDKAVESRFSSHVTLY